MKGYFKSRSPAVSGPYAVADTTPESLLRNLCTRPKSSAAAISFVPPDVLNFLAAKGQFLVGKDL